MLKSDYYLPMKATEEDIEQLNESGYLMMENRSSPKDEKLTHDSDLVMSNNLTTYYGH